MHPTDPLHATTQFVGTPPPVGGLPPRWTGPPLRSVALSAAGGVTTDPPSVGVLAVSPLKRSPSFSRTATGASKSPIFTMKTSHAAKRQGDSLRRGPTEQARPHTYMWSIYAVAGLVLLAVALYKLWQRSSSPQYARIVPSDDYDDLPDLIDTSWTTTTGAWTWTSSCSDPILRAVSSSATRTTRSD